MCSIEAVAFSFSIMGVVASISSTLIFPLVMVFGWLIPTVHHDCRRFYGTHQFRTSAGQDRTVFLLNWQAVGSGWAKVATHLTHASLRSHWFVRQIIHGHLFPAGQAVGAASVSERGLISESRSGDADPPQTNTPWSSFVLSLLLRQSAHKWFHGPVRTVNDFGFHGDEKYLCSNEYLRYLKLFHITFHVSVSGTFL